MDRCIPGWLMGLKKLVPVRLPYGCSRSTFLPGKPDGPACCVRTTLHLTTSMLVKNEIGCAPSGFEPWGAHRQRRVGILLNPRSGTTQSGFDACLQVLAQHKHVIHREVVTPEDIAAALVAMAAQQVDVLAVCGGDGTVQATLTTLFHTKPFEVRPPLALLAGGTTNMTAADVGIGGKPARALQRLLAWSEGSGSVGQIERRGVLRVDRGPDCAPF